MNLGGRSLAELYFLQKGRATGYHSAFEPGTTLDLLGNLPLSRGGPIEPQADKSKCLTMELFDTDSL